MGSVYILRNKINNKYYVGQTTRSFKERFLCHKTSHSIIVRSIRKYGKENFTFLLLKNIPEKELDYWEKHYINECNSLVPYGYNLEGGGNKNKKLHEETKKKMSKAQKKIGNKPPSWEGKHHTEETKKKMSEVKKGKVVSKETRKKISEYNKGKTSPRKGIRTPHPCPVCGKQRKEYHWNGKFQFYNKTCGDKKCKKTLILIGRGICSE